MTHLPPQVIYQLYDAQEALVALTEGPRHPAPSHEVPTSQQGVAAATVTMAQGAPGSGAGPVAMQAQQPLFVRAPLAEWHNKALSDGANLKEEYMVSGYSSSFHSSSFVAPFLICGCMVAFQFEILSLASGTRAVCPAPGGPQFGH